MRLMVPRRATVTSGTMSQRRHMELPMSILRKRTTAAKKAMARKKTMVHLLTMVPREATVMTKSIAMKVTSTTAQA